MSKALKSVNYRNAPVTTALPGQVENSTGGFVYQVGIKERLERFLILGTDGGTYYASEQNLTQQNVDWIINAIHEAPGVVLNTLLDVSVSGRAYRNSAALFVLALFLNNAEPTFKGMAVDQTPNIARTATHLYELAQYLENTGGWGRAKRRAVSNWFNSRSPEQLAYQAIKYRSRGGWTLRDLMRLAHPVGVDRSVGGFILSGDVQNPYINILAGFDAIQKADKVKDVIDILEDFPNLPWETIPTQFLKDPEVWKKLFHNGQLKGQALLRNVTRMARIGAFDDMVFAAEYANLLADEDMITKSKVHPIQYLLAQVVYTEGQVDRNYGYNIVRRKDWGTTPKIISALQNGFYKSFQNVEPSNKRTMIGVDVSGSMSWNTAIGSELTAAQGAAAMAMVTARVEPYTAVYGFADSLRDLSISPEMSFSEIMKKVQVNNFGRTDPSLLMAHATNNRIKVDTFVVITDNEVNQGAHPSHSLQNYRDKMGIDAKLVVMGMTATDFTIADPADRGMLDVCGFDSNAPRVVSDFSAGRL